MSKERLTEKQRIKFEAVKTLHDHAKGRCGHCIDCFYFGICMHCDYDMRENET